MPTRAETQQQTREALIAAAAKLFGERGVGATSVREIAKEAGYTRGAFYANFTDAEELFLEVLDAKLDQRLDVLEDQERPDPRTSAESWIAHLDADPGFSATYFDFAAHAGRNPSFRERFCARHRAMRRRLSVLLGKRLPADAPITPERLAQISFVLANGLAVERIVDPAHADAGLYAEIIELLSLGLLARQADS